MQFPHLQDKKIAILGYGREGKSTLQFLLKQEIVPANITILDKNPIDLGDIKSPLPPFIKGGSDYLQNLENYDIIFKSAGIPYTPEIQQVKEKLITQVQFFFDHYQGKVIALTASKGKTTMTSLAYQLLLDAGLPVTLAGNIGKPVLDQVDLEDKDGYVVIELSSFMLETLHKKNLVSILGSIFPVHLDRHGSMENYLKAKANILKGSEYNIVFSSTKEQYFPDAQIEHLTLCGKGTNITRDENYFYAGGKQLFTRSEIKLLGEHNLWNISAIVALAQILKIDEKILVQTLKNFSAVRHRLEKVGTFKGIDFYDDAISTSPYSTIAALDALGDQVDTLFLGGVDGRYDFASMVERVKKSQIANLVLFPDSGPTIEKLLGEHSYNILHTRDMQEAVAFAYKYTKPGKIALLSTATPSFSVWKDFEEKGDLFQQRVKKVGTS